jgi:hypothetical protein
MNAISGIGWITQKRYGCLKQDLSRSYPDIGSLRADLEAESVLRYPVKKFGKFDLVSKITCCVAALALYDAEMPYSEGHKQNIGILGTNRDGCLQSNVEFFRDFVENGRTLGRANLFVYTLPSIPVAEAAIYLKCEGPLLYMAFPRTRVASLLRQADRMISREGAPVMLALESNEEEGLCFAVRREEDVAAGTGFGLEEVIAVGEDASTLDEMIGAFAAIHRAKKGHGEWQADPQRKGRL